MADIRINALATTAASTASDDFIAIDGSANGTRKLNAYSPTFGGNLTVNGTANLTGIVTTNSSTGFTTFGGRVVISDSSGIRGTSSTIGLFSASGVAYFGNYDSATGLKITLSTGAAEFTNNLTVSGTATIKNGLAASATGTAFSVQTTDANSLVLFAELEGNATSSLRYASLNAYMNGGGGGRNLVLNRYGGDVLIGATVNGGNGKLQLADHTTSAGGIGFGTDTSLFRSSANTLRAGAGGSFLLLAPDGTTYNFQIYRSGVDAILRLTKEGVADWDFLAGTDLVIKRNNTTAMTLDSSQRCILAGALRLNNAYTAGAPTATGYVTLQDSAGNTYKVLVGT